MLTHGTREECARFLKIQPESINRLALDRYIKRADEKGGYTIAVKVPIEEVEKEAAQ